MFFRHSKNLSNIQYFLNREKKFSNGFSLTKFFSTHLTGSCKTAFTLAEVLITLGIIGVVAALTLPSMIANKERKELHTALKKNYSVLQQSLLSMSKDYGDTITRTTHSGMEFANNYKNYFNYIKYCNNEGCIGKEVNPDDSDNRNRIKNYKTYNKSKNIRTIYFDDGQIILNDGAFIMIEHSAYGLTLTYITVDVNGYNKKPNAWGHDVFTFQLMDNGKLLPMGMEGTRFIDESTYCSKDSSNNVNGIGCTEKALNDPNYWKNLP